jgi:hypothetical protein
MSELDQQVAFIFLSKRGCFARNIHDRVQTIYADAAYAFPSVYIWIRECECERKDIID